jgi:hypothetical protein
LRGREQKVKIIVLRERLYIFDLLAAMPRFLFPVTTRDLSCTCINDWSMISASPQTLGQTNLIPQTIQLI